jgi:hypothetical protein
MDTQDLVSAPSRPAKSGRSDPAAPATDTEIDWERVVYDPAYRRSVRDQLNRAKARKTADPE